MHQQKQKPALVVSIKIPSKLLLNFTEIVTTHLTMKNVILSVLILFFCFKAEAQTGKEIFWQELQKLCGKAFEGKLLLAPPNDTGFTGKILQMHVRGCEENRIRIPFHVGNNFSRTWVLTNKKEGLLLKHDHRHEDGTPDRITMYGGLSTNSGTNVMQIFPADQETVNLLPRAATNVWWMTLSPGKSFTYNLRVIGSDRQFSIEFDLTREIQPPPAPWGWRE